MRIGLQIPSFTWPGGPSEIGSRLADEMYQRTFTVVSVDSEEFERLLSAERLRIAVDGSIEVIEPVSNREADYTL